jgi:hypothetical protein
MAKIEVLNKEITIFSNNDADYISITDMARYKDSERTDYIIQNWMRNRSTIEFLGVWEQLNNPDFKPIEFDGFRRQAGLNSFILTPKQWIEKQLPLEWCQNQADTGVLTLIKILPLNLHHGFRWNLSCI